MAAETKRSRVRSAGIPAAGTNATRGFDVERLARRALRGTLFVDTFRDGLVAAIADADARIAKGSVASWEIHDGWDEEGREIVHAVPITVRSPEAERLDRAVAPARTMLIYVRRTLDLLAAQRAIGRLR